MSIPEESKRTLVHKVYKVSHNKTQFKQICLISAIILLILLLFGSIVYYRQVVSMQTKIIIQRDFFMEQLNDRIIDLKQKLNIEKEEARHKEKMLQNKLSKLQREHSDLLSFIDNINQDIIDKTFLQNRQQQSFNSKNNQKKKGKFTDDSTKSWKKTITQESEKLQKNLNQKLSSMKQKFNDLTSNLQDQMKQLKSNLQGSLSDLKSNLGVKIEKTKDHISGTSSKVKQGLTIGMQKMKQNMEKMTSKMGQKMFEAGDILSEKIGDLSQNLAFKMKGFGQNMLNLGSNYLKMQKNFINGNSGDSYEQQSQSSQWEC